jgi:hypothetical protein
MRTVPHEWKLQHNDDGVRFVSSKGFSGNEQSESRCSRDPAAMRGLSYDLCLAAGKLRSLKNRFSIDGSSRKRPVRAVSYQWELQPDDNSLRELPLKPIPGHNESESRVVGIPTAVRDLPHNL